MNQGADISSIDALDAFRAELIAYMGRAKAVLEETEGDVRRLQTWLAGENRDRWMREIKHRTKLLQQAEEELFSAGLANPRGANAFQKMAVLKARRMVEEAEAKLRVAKKWEDSMPARATDALKRLDPLSQHVFRELPKGVHFLTEAVKALQAYAEKSPAPVSRKNETEETE